MGVLGEFGKRVSTYNVITCIRSKRRSHGCIGTACMHTMTQLKSPDSSLVLVLATLYIYTVVLDFGAVRKRPPTAL